MTVHITEAEAAALGIGKKKRTTKRKAPRNGNVTVCLECGERFTTDARENDHVEKTKHARYELLLEDR